MTENTPLQDLFDDTAGIVGRAFFSASGAITDVPEVREAFRIVCREMAKHMSPEEIDQVLAMTMLDMRDPCLPIGESKTEPEIEPCPFCRGEASILEDHDGFTVGCAHVSAADPDLCSVAPRTLPFRSREAAITAWNTRPEP